MWFADGLGWQKHRRHDAAARSFETAARVDNRWLAQANAQPYEIPNIVRNAEARCQSLTNAGRFAEAAAVSKELIALPRNPRWPNQSAERGRRCLLATLATAEQWKAIIALDGGPWLRDTDPIARADRAFAMGRAYAWTGNLKAARTLARQLDTTSREFRWLADIIALASGDLTALQRLREEGYPATLLLHAALRAEAIQKAGEILDDAPITATTQAARVEVSWARGMNTDAKKAFDLLRQQFHKCDLSAAPFRRLEEIAKALDYPADWRLPTQGDGLSALGPPRWSPDQAPDFLLTRGDGKSVKLSDHLGRPVLLVFFLGFGCIHCVEQLQGLHPMAGAFKVAGIDIVTIGTDTVQEVRASIQAAVETDTPAIPFPVLCDPKGTVFKTWRCWDDFENQPLHGTFLIDRQGRIRWSDISVEPFMQAELLLRECKRLLAVTSR